MTRQLLTLICRARIWMDTSGQDVLEYALYVAAIGTLYAAFSPSVASDVAHIISRIDDTLSTAAKTGGTGG